MAQDTPEGTPEAGADSALEGGNYEVIRQRLITQAGALRERAEGLNAQRKETFGGTELQVLANGRVRTEHNCVPRDIVSVSAGGNEGPSRLLLGYNVTMGLKQETAVSDVLSVHRFEALDPEDGGGEGFDFHHVPVDEVEFLAHEQFGKDFTDLYRYYRDAALLQLTINDQHLLAAFQVGESHTDLKVFKWNVEPRGLRYIDNRGDRNYSFPHSHDFEWTLLEREHQVHGRHPHFNILDTVFVEAVGGDLTIKVEDSTDTGAGIYAEPVEDGNQTLDDGEYHYAALGTLILLRIRPYRETEYRYLVFNTRTHGVARIDAIGKACVQLPEDHGIIFPGGYYLQDGTSKVFDEEIANLEFKRVVRSPNGEDVLYVFYRRVDGHYALLPYNLIRKEVQTPIHCHGYSIFADGRMVVFRSVNDEPTRVHPMQVWQTPFVSVEFAAAAPTDGSTLAKIGNADLVRGISDALSIARACDNTSPTRQTYEDLIRALGRMEDAYYWLSNPEAGDLLPTLRELSRTAELIVDEFEKVVAFKAQAEAALAEHEVKQAKVIEGIRPEELRDVDAFMKAMTALRGLRGHLITMRELRFVDLKRIDELEAQSVESFDQITQDCVRFLLRDEALGPLKTDIEALLVSIEAVEKVTEILPLKDRMDELSGGLDLLTEVITGLQIDDATQRTQILEGITEVFGQLNRVRATLDGRRRELAGREGRAEFGAQFKLFGQSVASALALCDTPERCDEELSRLMVSLQELEARFSEFDEFLADLAAKREETYEAFGAKKQTLLDERQRRVGNILSAVDRIFEGVARRVRSFAGPDELNAWFASDGMVMKVRQLAEQLVTLGDTVKSEEVLGRLKMARQNALRGLRDRLDLFDEGEENLIKLGNHKFAVNTQKLEMTMVPRGEGMSLHLTGTDFYEPVTEEDFQATKPFWSQVVVSEDKAVYRGEYLAASLLFAAERGEGMTLAGLVEAQRDGTLAKLVQDYAQQRYDEGYERGLHDADAALILDKLLSLGASAGLLRYSPGARAVAALFWGSLITSGAGGAQVEDAALRQTWHRKAMSLGRLKELFGQHAASETLARQISQTVDAFLEAQGLEPWRRTALQAARYLLEELAVEHPRFTTSLDATQLRDGLLEHLQVASRRRAFEEDLALLDGLAPRLALAQAWIEALVGSDAERSPDPEVVFEAAVILAGAPVDRETSSAVTSVDVHGLLGQHPRVIERNLHLRLDEFRARVGHFVEATVPAYKRYRELRHEVVERARLRLRLNEFDPKVMSSFVRNKLINDVYLPIIGDNLAKQMGAAGDKKRTDLMGLLLLISPPGYGKTTLMEYVANRMGLVFVKVNGPSLGHSVHSLDPEEAPNATARQEVEKINFAFEMGNNVMLYLDDIQHTHPELLQKFISLCDGQRKVEGVWKGRTRTYDMKGKKFCVVMAGNPYTETGDKFQIPDMLANRADTYNLGDILEGRDHVFALSYIENSLTSNPTLAPLATREQADTYKLIEMAQGKEVPSTDLKHGYSNVELGEITEVLRRLFIVQKVVLAVNLQYIESAATDETFRVEPAFKMQGSYRNMNKLAEKIVAAMTTEEVESLVDDHYQGEAQTLTTGAEQNLLKLAELRGRLSDEQSARWTEIKRTFKRVQAAGGDEGDPVNRVTGVLGSLGEQIEKIGDALAQGAGQSEALAGVAARLGGIEAALTGGSSSEGLGDLEKAIAMRLDGIRTALADRGARKTAPPLGPRGGGGILPAKPAPAAPAADMTALLGSLEGIVKRIAAPQLEVTVQNQAPPGVEELLAQQVAIIERTLVPLVKTSVDHLGESRAIEGKLDELLEMLRARDATLRE